MECSCKRQFTQSIDQPINQQLLRFPLDTQVCPLDIGSFAYGGHEMRFKWAPGKGVDFDAAIGISQFTLHKVTIQSINRTRADGD